jgi:signal transduction histidine kinase
MIGVIYDITERKALEKQKDEFISLASHELKTPVTSIKSYTELLHEILLESGEQQNVKLVEKLNSQVDRLINLFNLLLDSTKISHGRIDLTLQTFDLTALIAERLEEFRYLSATHEIIFEASSIPPIHADRERIGQVITNLVSNAIKYSPDATKIIVRSEDGLDGAVVKVQDFGIGISSEDQVHLFTQYYRGPNSETQKHSGFGLGLYISAEIIRQHHGLIGVESKVGEGSTFFFKLFYT